MAWKAVVEVGHRKIKHMMRQTIASWDSVFGVKINEMADDSTIWANYDLTVSGGSGTFTDRETLSFAPSGATGQFVILSGSTFKFRLTSTTVPTTSDTVTGDSSSATRDIDAVTKIE